MVQAEQVDLLLRGCLTLTMNAEREVFRRGYVAVRDGLIAAVGDEKDCDYSAKETIDARDKVILPGFVNVHSHLLGGYVRGLGGEQFVTVGAALSDRLSTRLRGVMDEESCYYGARLALMEMQKSGVTTTCDSQPGLRGLESN